MDFDREHEIAMLRASRKQKLGALVLATGLLMLISSPALAWDPITHYHINRLGDPGFREPHVYRSSGTGPDVFFFIRDPYADYAHAPHPNKPEWRDDPNCAYLMLKINGLRDTTSDDYIAAKGWGGHIAADWVAHTGNK